MRITNNILTKGYLNNLSKNLRDMQKLQQQGSTGKKVAKPSDDPILVGKIMNIRNEIIENENYNNTIKDSQAWISSQDTALEGAARSMRKIRDLTIAAAKDSHSEVDRKAIQAEVKAEIDAITDVLNATHDGRYIFAGQQTKTRPFLAEDTNFLSYVGSDKPVKREISKGIDLELINVGNRLSTLTGDPAGKELGVFLKELHKDVGEMDKTNTLSNKHLEDLDKYLDNLVAVRTQIGAVDNRLEAAKDRNEADNISLKDMLSQKEDVDLVENYIESTLKSTIYQASLSIGARILQPSLLDYLN